MYVHEALAKGLYEHGVDVLFGLMGDGNVFFADSFAAIPGTRWVPSAHEAGAVTAANGYANVTGRVGAVTVTHGPGLTNTVTALVDSVRGGQPVLLICGDTAVSDEQTLQKIEQKAVISVTGAGFVQVRSAESALIDLREALRLVRVTNKPVVLNVPIDFMWEQIEYVHRALISSVARTAPARADVERAVEVIASAARPIVLAGRGAAGPVAHEALTRLAERVGAPVATTLKGSSLFRGDPGNLGVFGTLSSDATLEAIGRSDCVMSFGASLNLWTTDSRALLAGKTVVQCDVDPGALGRYAPETAGVVGDVAAVADAIRDLFDEATLPASGFRQRHIERATEADSIDVPAVLTPGESLDFYQTIRAVDALMPPDKIVVVDAGRFMFEGYKLLSVQDPRSLVHTCNFGSIGLSMGNAIGAAVGSPDRTVMLVCGDGGFMLGSLAEFATAAANGLDIVVALINDSSYGAEHIQFLNRDLDPSRTTFKWPDFAELAIALGGQGVVWRTPEDFDIVRKAVEQRSGPLLIDIRFSPYDVPSSGGGH